MDLLQRVTNKLRRETLRRASIFRQPLRAAVIGCGFIAARHVNGFTDTGEARVVAVSDVLPRTLARAVDRWPFVRAYRDYREMLEEVRPDVVSVCTWPQSHAEIVCIAARAGVRGILCEKPIALCMDQIREMISVCRSQGTKLAVGHQYRFHPIFSQGAEAISANAVGAARVIQGTTRGSIANNGPHLIDVVRFVLGDPIADRVECHARRESSRIERGLPCEDSATIEIDFAGGVHSHLETGAEDQRAFDVRVEGETGVLEITPELLRVNGQRVSFLRHRAATTAARRQFGDFVRWVKGKQDAYAADATSASVTTEIVLAAYESARLGAAVTLPLANHGPVITRLYPSGADPVPGNELSVSSVPSTRALGAFDRLAMDGGRRAVRRWFSTRPAFGPAEWTQLASVMLTRKLSSTSGTVTRQLESEVCRFYGTAAAVASSSGTAAIHVALAALDLDPCDEVITTPITDMGTVIPILACNCVPVFADVSPETGNLTAETIAAQITPRTRAVIVVHLFGRPVDLSPIVDLVREHGLALIEDCAQAHGAEYDGRKVGTFGDLGCFSLQQSKQISCGDGGFTLVNRPDLEERSRLFVDKGWMRHGEGRGHRFLGMNYRMTELQAAVAKAQMRKLPRLLASRRASALELTRQLRAIPGIVLPTDDHAAVSSWWKVAVGIDEDVVGARVDDVLDALIVEGVRATRPYRPRPLFAEEMLRDQRTYGSSRFPFTDDYRVPRIESFPGVREFDRKWLLIPWGNRVPPSCVDGIAKAFRKVIGARP